mmetsp:Transcript_6803/g.15786  ORF Transcript_6803/g.15786 Transcript_6803/m.15786 type:complete len:267 (-) Transcript_6803:4705-5505(-)
MPPLTACAVVVRRRANRKPLATVSVHRAAQYRWPEHVCSDEDLVVASLLTVDSSVHAAVLERNTREERQPPCTTPHVVHLQRCVPSRGPAQEAVGALQEHSERSLALFRVGRSDCVLTGCTPCTQKVQCAWRRHKLPCRLLQVAHTACRHVTFHSTREMDNGHTGQLPAIRKKGDAFARRDHVTWRRLESTCGLPTIRLRYAPQHPSDASVGPLAQLTLLARLPRKYETRNIACHFTSEHGHFEFVCSNSRSALRACCYTHATRPS